MAFRNAFLSAMSFADKTALAPHLREVALEPGKVLCESGELPDYVYFPGSSIISVVTVLRDGRAFETASIGFEGVAGLLSALTGFPSTTRSFVQVGGGAARLPAAALQSRIEDSTALRKLILRSAQMTAAQTEQSVACNAYHHVSARLARWLLVTHDRVESATIFLTQEYLGVMVGALRSSISISAGAFKEAGLIDYARGRLEILDRAGLERRSCECYSHDKASRAALFQAA
ncbi:MAG: Crp/Fnr family transcriptional regulator [Pseudomonadota bacterium]